MSVLNEYVKTRLIKSALIILGVVVIGLLISATQNSTQLETEGATKGYARWSEVIEKRGPASAYKEFVKAYQNTPFGTQHEMAHIFGELLYDFMGVDGITVCDASFAFGCYHGFFTVAIASEGSSAISFFDKACEEADSAPSACRHGIGHGIMEYLGPQKLDQALSLCKETTWSSPIGGCLSGVFMEYNVPLLKDESGEYTVVARPIDSQNPYGPCMSVTEDSKQSCYHELPHWWMVVYDKNYEKIGKLCESVENTTFRSNCFVGVGNIVAPTTDYTVEETVSTCKKMPSQEGSALCRLSAARSFLWNPKGERSAHDVCAGVASINGLVCPN